MRLGRDALASITVGQIADVDGARPEEVRQELKNGSLFYRITDMHFDDDRFLHLEDSVSTIRGIWDLALRGSERLDVEHRFEQLTDGPEITGVNLSGTFVKRENGCFASLQTSFNSPEMREINKDFKKIFEAALAKSGKSKPPPKEPKPHDHPDNFFPAGKLPDDSVLVVRTSALTELQKKMTEATAAPQMPRESSRERNYLLRIIGLMAYQKYSSAMRPGSIAALLMNAARELDVSEVEDQTIAKHVKTAIDLVGAKEARDQAGK